VALLKRAQPRTVPLAGGVWLTPRLAQVSAEAVVDLSDLGLHHIEREPAALRLGAMATLAALTHDETCITLAGGTLAHTARRDAAINVRNVATVGGTILVAPVDSELILALLALGATVTLQADSTITMSLSQFMANPAAALGAGLLTHVQIPLPRQITSGAARIARTPSDHPIVAAFAIAAHEPAALRIALGGVNLAPIVLELEQPAALEQAITAALAAGEPYQDFRGTAEYRRAMAPVLARRALEQALSGGAQ
jgi:CO/xanthine dehydrogenase FAD-binding subunit